MQTNGKMRSKNSLENRHDIHVLTAHCCCRCISIVSATPHTAHSLSFTHRIRANARMAGIMSTMWRIAPILSYPPLSWQWSVDYIFTSTAFQSPALFEGPCKFLDICQYNAFRIVRRMELTIWRKEWNRTRLSLSLSPFRFAPTDDSKWSKIGKLVSRSTFFPFVLFLETVTIANCQLPIAVGERSTIHRNNVKWSVDRWNACR